MPDAEAAKCKTVLQELLTPETCWVKYLRQDERQDGPVGEDEDADEQAPDSAAMSETKQNFNRVTGQLLDLLLKVVAGREYFSDLAEVAAVPGGLLKSMQKHDEQCCNRNSEKDPKASSVGFLKELRAITLQFDGQGKGVAVTAAAPPPSLLMNLSREKDHVLEDAERERLWKQVQAERRRFISFSFPRSWKQDQILGAFRSSGKVFAHTGELNTSHRLFVAAADLLHEEGDEPWNSVGQPPVGMWKEIANFVGSVNGPSDFGMLFDGRVRDVRKHQDTCQHERVGQMGLLWNVN